MHFTTLTALFAFSLAVSANANVHGSVNDMAKRHDQPVAGRAGRMHRRSRKRGTCKKPASASSSAWSSSTPTVTPVAKAAAGNYAKESSTWSSSSAPASSTGSNAEASYNNDVTVTSNALSSAGVSSFLGTNTGIGSWFKTDSSSDSTNGRSWCQLNYQDDWIGFAPDVSTMLNNFGGDTTKAGTAYCGLEAEATNPSNGKTVKMYIVDGFDSKWVRTPGSVDLTMAAFEALFEWTDDKNTVIQGLQWKLTGNRKAEYAFNYGS